MTFRENAKSLAGSIRTVLAAHTAVSLILLFCFFVTTALVADMDVADFFEDCLPAAPLAIVAALVIDSFTKNKYLSLAVIPVLCITAFIPGIEDWGFSTSFCIATFVVLPLVLLIYRRSFSNEGFVRNAVWTAWSAILALALSCILLALLLGLVFTVTKLFDCDIEDTVCPLCICFCFILLAPLLFIGISEKENIPGIQKVLGAIVNWIVSPAVVIYTAILYFYSLKILATWELPCGGVAVMCFIWGIFALIVASVQPILEKHPFRWFEKSYGYLALPLLVLLWVAIARRVWEYGLTPSRYFLVLCGITMTAFIAISFFRKKNVYYIATAVAAALFTLSLVAPGVNYNSASVSSQIHRARKAAEKLGVLASDGSLLEKNIVITDETEADYDRLQSALCELTSLKQTALKKLGIKTASDYLSNYSNASNTLEISKQIKKERVTIERSDYFKDSYSVQGFSKVYFDVEIKIENGKLIAGNYSVNLDEFLRTQLKKINVSGNISSRSYLKDHSEDLLVYDFPDARLILSTLPLTLQESVVTIEPSSYFGADAVLLVK